MTYLGHVDLRHTATRAHIISEAYSYWAYSGCGLRFDQSVESYRGKAGKPLCKTCLRSARATLRCWDQPTWKQGHPDWANPSTPLGRQRRDMEALRALVESEEAHDVE